MKEFNLRPLPDLSDAILQQKDQESLNEFINKVDLYLITEESASGDFFPESIFELALRLMQSEIFLAFQGSSKLLMLFETDWARLSEEQKHKLLLAIEKSYDRFTDPMSWFIGSELLGEYYCHEDAFEVLRRLKQTTNINARALIPHGFEHLVKGAKDPGLRTRAFAELRSLLNDPSENVRAEAAESLSRLPQT